MPPDETLSAVVKARDRISGTLNDISGSFRDVAKTARSAAAASSSAAASFDEAEDEGSALSRALDSISGNSVQARGGLSAARRSADEAGDTFSRAAWKTHGLNEQLERIRREAIPAAASLTTLRAASAGLGGDVGIGAGAETTDARRSLRNVQNTVRRLDASDVAIDTDVEGEEAAQADLGSIRRLAELVDRETARPRIDLKGVTDTLAGIGTVDRALGSLDGRTATVDVETDRDSLRDILADIDAFGSDFGTARAAVDVDAEGDEETEADLLSVRRLAETIDRKTAHPRIDLEGVTASLTGVGAVDRALSGLDGRTATTHIETDRDSLRDLLGDIADIGADVDSVQADVDVDAEGADETQADLSGVQAVAETVDRTRARPHIEAEGTGETLGEIAAVDRAISALDRREADVDTNVEGGRAAMGGVLRGIGQSLSRRDLGIDASSLGLDSLTGVVDVDYSKIAKVQGEIRELRDDLTGLPTFDLDVESEEDLDVLAGQLRGASDASQTLRGTLSEIDDDTIIRDADSVDDLRRKLVATEHDTTRAVRALDRLDGAGRDVVDGMIAGSESVDEFGDQADQTGDRALKASGKLAKFKGAARDLIVETSVAAKTSDELADEIDDVGDESVKAALQVGTLRTSLRGLSPEIGSITTRLGPFTTQLSNWINLLPIIASLTSALGGLATAGGAAGGALAGIFAGGMLAQGEQMADSMSTMANATGATGDRVEDLEEAGSELERTMIGVEEVMARIKGAAYRAMAPLRTPEFADFTMTAIEGTLTLVHEIAQGIAAMSDEWTSFASAISGVFWGELEAIGTELGALVRDLLPAFQALITGTIRALPGLFNAMRQEGNELVPLLSDFVNALVDALPALTTWGTMLLKILLPALTGVLEGIAALTPYIEWLADTLDPVIDKLSPLIRDAGKLVGIFGALSVAATTVISLLGLAVGIFASMAIRVASLVRIGAMLLPFLKGVVGWIARLGALGPAGIIAGIALAVGSLMSYFDLWDEWLWKIMQKWNTLVSVFSIGAGIIGTALEAALAPVTDWLNGILDKAGDLLGRDFGQFGTYDYEPLDYEGMMLEREQATAWASHIPGQAADGGGGKDPAADIRSGVEGARARTEPDRGRGGGGRRRGRRDTQNTATNIEHIEVNVGDDQNPARIQKAVADGVAESERRNRRRQTGGN